HQLPIEDGGDAAATLEEVPRPVVAVHQADARRDGSVCLQPRDRPLEHRVRPERPAIEELFPEGDLARRRGRLVDIRSERFERRAAPLEAMDGGKRRHELLRERLAGRWRKRLLPFAYPRQRGFTLDLLADEERSAECVEVLAVPVDA